MEGFPSGQREQTVNLSSMTSVVRIHHLPPKEPILIRVSVLFWCQVEWIRKPALRNVPVARFNRRGFRRNGSESTTGRVGRRVAVRRWDCTSQSRQAEALFEGTKGRHAPNPKGRTGCPTMKSTCTGHRRGAPACAPGQPSARIPIGSLFGKGQTHRSAGAYRKEYNRRNEAVNRLQTHNRRGGQWPPTPI